VCTGAAAGHVALRVIAGIEAPPAAALDPVETLADSPPDSPGKFGKASTFTAPSNVDAVWAAFLLEALNLLICRALAGPHFGPAPASGKRIVDRRLGGGACPAVHALTVVSQRDTVRR